MCHHPAPTAPTMEDKVTRSDRKDDRSKQKCRRNLGVREVDKDTGGAQNQELPVGRAKEALVG